MIDLVRTDAALFALEAEWAALWDRTEAATPFQSPHWLLPWWRQFGTGMPRVAVRRENGRLTGVLPLYVLPGERKALPIGAGTTDYLDGLGDLAGLLAACRHALRTDPVDALDLIEVPPGSALLGEPASWTGSSPCPVLTLAEIPAGIRRKLRMSRHRADREGGWRMEAGGLDALFRLHRARWQSQGEPGVLADPAVAAFWQDAAPALDGAGLLRLRTLLLDGVAAASILALVAPGRLFFYASGYDAARAFVSPGTLLLGAMLEEAAAEGRTEAHFLRGQEAYKYAWGARDRRNYACRFAFSSVDST